MLASFLFYIDTSVYGYWNDSGVTRSIKEIDLRDHKASWKVGSYYGCNAEKLGAVGSDIYLKGIVRTAEERYRIEHIHVREARFVYA